uniref:Uncharacterized protein n=1 Tax=Anguilla anguilla TaxID=7936 RepID=A0A0E9SYZ5_ANGAN
MWSLNVNSSSFSPVLLFELVSLTPSSVQKETDASGTKFSRHKKKREEFFYYYLSVPCFPPTRPFLLGRGNK